MLLPVQTSKSAFFWGDIYKNKSQSDFDTLLLILKGIRSTRTCRHLTVKGWSGKRVEGGDGFVNLNYLKCSQLIF